MSTRSQMKLGLLQKAAIGAVASTVLWVTSPAAAQEQSTIRNPNDHPNYPLEVEPHALVGLSSRFDGVGVGGRFSIPIVPNGFVPSINNSVAVGLGVDWAHRDGCFGFAGCGGADGFWIPAALQWNFFLATHWSAFVEPGLALGHTTYSDVCAAHDQAGNLVYADCSRGDTYVDPALFVGGRYHASDHFALTMRVGYPYLSLGGSFM